MDRHFYRVDSFFALRKISSDTFFRPVRWSSDSYGIPHKALCKAETALENQSIYRICFWFTRERALSDFHNRDCQTPRLLLRIPRSSVVKALYGWQFDDDDFLPGDATLIWNALPGLGEYCPIGIPLKEFEIWDGESWESWESAKALQPDTIRMAEIGWSPISTRTIFNELINAHWCVIGSYCLICADSCHQSSLGGNHKAIELAVNILLLTSLSRFNEFTIRFIVITPTMDRLLHSEFRCTPTGLNQSWLEMLMVGGKSTTSFSVIRDPVLTNDLVMDLIKKSNLRFARPELPDGVWYF